jgi:ADP-ribose pyrophosphatase YjhB (NUDIX family)
MKKGTLLFAPRDVFKNILEYAVIPTFDLIVRFEDRGVILVRRKIAPYKNTWGLPGLRMMKPEGIEDTLKRIASTEIGVCIDTDRRKFIGQYVGWFRTERLRQDLSTCYAVPCDAQDVVLNREHFSGCRFIQGKREVPMMAGAMYRYFLELYFDGKTV